MTDVRVFKLVSGQEFIGKVISGPDAERDTSKWLVESPLTLQPMRSDRGLEVGLIPFSFGGNSKQVVIDPNNILCVLPAADDVQNAYLGALGGLIVPEGPAPRIVLT